MLQILFFHHYFSSEYKYYRQILMAFLIECEENQEKKHGFGISL